MTSTKAKPTTAGEWEDYLMGLDTPQKFQEAFNSGDFQNNLKSYTQARNAEREDLREQVGLQVQAAITDMLKSGTVPTNRLNLTGGKPGPAAQVNPQAPGAPLNGLYGSFAEYLQNALGNEKHMAEEDRQKYGQLQKISNAYSSTSGDKGGFLIPEEWRTQIFSGPELESAIVRPRATVIPMSSKSLHFPAVDFSTEVGEVFGGMAFYWMDESGTIPDTDALFAQIELNANRLAGAAVVPNDTMKDSGALDAWLRSALPRGIRDFEDRAFLKGDGVKKPLGALTNHPAMIVAGDETGQSTASITWLNVLAMFSRLLPESYDNAVWIASPDTLPEIFTMALPVGTGGSAVMVAPGTGNQALSFSMLGRPILFSRKAPATLGTQGDLSLVDLSYYAVGDRQDVRVETSEHARFLQDDTVFKVIERVDGTPLLLSPLTPENGGPTLSAYIQLETRTLD